MAIRSTNGVDWTQTPAIPLEKDLFDLTEFQGKVIAVGTNGAITRSSNDGFDWTPVTTWAIDFIDSDDIQDICSGEGATIAIDEFGNVFRSVNLLTWQTIIDLGAETYAVEWIHGAFWIVGDNGLIARSETGISWETRNSGSDGRYFSITSNGETLVAVGLDRLDGTARVASSLDGIDWVEMRLDGLNGNPLQSVAWSGSRFLAVGGPIIASSPDGFSWVFEVFDPDLWLDTIVSDGFATILAGQRFNLYQVFKSEDQGENWEGTLSDIRIFDLAWTEHHFVFVDGGNIWSSSSGQSWQINQVGLGGGGTALTGTGGGLLLAGSNGWILRSQRVRPLTDPRSLQFQ